MNGFDIKLIRFILFPVDDATFGLIIIDPFLGLNQSLFEACVSCLTLQIASPQIKACDCEISMLDRVACFHVYLIVIIFIF